MPLASTQLTATTHFSGYPPGSTASFLSVATAAFSVTSGFDTVSAAAGFAPVEPSSARMVSSRDSRPERALFHQPFPLMLPVSSFLYKYSKRLLSRKLCYPSPRMYPSLVYVRIAQLREKARLVGSWWYAESPGVAGNRRPTIAKTWADMAF